MMMNKRHSGVTRFERFLKQLNCRFVEKQSIHESLRTFFGGFMTS